VKILIVYATTEGQTRKIARHGADHLVAQGHSAEVLAAAEAEGLAPDHFDAVVLAGSLHAGQFQKALRGYAGAHAQALNARPSLFLAVSLTAAGHDTDERAELDACVKRFCDETGWRPGRIAHVAGALLFSEYDFFRYWAMRWIARSRGEQVTGKEDVEFTDWPALDRTLDDWLRDR
jgi:menaquinone-dependent protoporphyrinogen oxidase